MTKEQRQIIRQFELAAIMFRRYGRHRDIGIRNHASKRYFAAFKKYSDLKL